MHSFETATSLFSADILSEIITQADRFPTLEVCGLVVQHEGDIKLVSLDNVATTAESAFAFDSDSYKKIVFSGAKILAVYHSHWSDEQAGFLGFDDICWSKKTRIPYLLFHTIDRTWDYFDPHDLNPFPLQHRQGSPQSIDYYLGWQYFWGRCDCYTLMRSYYRGRLGIDFSDYERSPSPRRQHLHPYKSFDQGLTEIGFVKLPDGATHQNHDVILMAIQGSISHHVGIFVDASLNHFIHHFSPDKLSEKSIYGSSYEESTRSIWRHRSLTNDA